MVKRQIMTVKNEGSSKYTEEEKARYNEAIEKRTPYVIDGIFYRLERVSHDEIMCYLTLETLEEEELYQAEKNFGIKHRNITGYLREENEDSRWVEKIVPIVAGEDFASMLWENEFLEYYDIEDIEYPEKLDCKITYDEELEEFNFRSYHYLVFVREGDKGHYKHWVQAYERLENIDLRDKKRKHEN